MSDLKGLLHLADSGATRPVALAWNDAAGVLHVKGEDVEIDVVATDLAISSGGWQGTAVHLVWQWEGRAWAITLTEHETIQALAGLFSVALARQLDRAILDGIQATRRGRLTLAVLALLVLLPALGFFVAWLFRANVVDAVVRRMPPAVDRQLGELTVAELSRSRRLVVAGPALDAVRAVGARLAAGEPAGGAAFRFELARDPSVNAYAAPGGPIVVHTGLLRSATSPDELAGVMAHEMTHVAERHTMRQVAFHAGLLAGLRLLVGSPDGAADRLTSAALDLTSLRFSREQELAADRGALDRLERARLSGAGLVSFFDRLARQGGVLPPFLSSHPAPAARSARLLDEMGRRRQQAVDPMILDWAAVQADAEALESGTSTRAAEPAR
jgi:beta-barrel assembly-enhancing protease